MVNEKHLTTLTTLMYEPRSPTFIPALYFMFSVTYASNCFHKLLS